ncbi:hypothetical protein LCGC14_2667750, partial [marine sediment metagenome]
MKVKSFRLNNYLELRLEKGKTIIYLQGKPVSQCLQLVMQIPNEDVGVYDFINSIDEANEVKNAMLEEEGLIERTERPLITPEEEFWGHSSNLQVWVEHGYDTRILHSNLSFPLLKRLMLAGDKKAKKVFNEEVAKRCDDGYVPVILTLFENGCINHLNGEQFNYVMSSLERLLNQELEQEDKIIVLFVLFIEQLKNHNLSRANKFYRHLKEYDIPENQKFCSLWRFAGRIYLRESENSDEELFLIERSKKCLKKAIDLDTTDFYSWYYLSKAYLKYNDKVKAIWAIRAALSIKPNIYKALFFLGEIYVAYKEYSKAIDVFTTASYLPADTSEVWKRLGFCFEQIKEFEMAITLYKGVLEIKPDKKVMYNLGINYCRVGNYNAAISIYKMILKEDDDNELVWRNLGLIYYNLNQFNLAIMCFKRLVRCN